jgi:uncharacterized protein YodC (DUF2158 family)
MDEIKAGDVVRLKSGSPRFTVGSIKDGIATLYWHPYGGNHMDTAEVAVVALVKEPKSDR